MKHIKLYQIIFSLGIYCSLIACGSQTPSSAPDLDTNINATQQETIETGTSAIDQASQKVATTNDTSQLKSQEHGNTIKNNNLTFLVTRTNTSKIVSIISGKKASTFA